MDAGEYLLAACIAINAGIAALHAAIIYCGAPAYRRFGAGEAMARMVEKGSWMPGLVTAGIALLFVVFTAYALSGAGWLQLPFTLTALLVISSIYTLRGAMLFPMLLITQEVSSFDIWSSLISLAIGVLHFAGAYWIWSS